MEIKSITKELLVLSVVAMLSSCGESLIKCRGEAKCENLNENMISQFEQGAIGYFGDDRGLNEVSHYSISPRIDDLKNYCGSDLTCYTGEAIVVSDDANAFQLCLGIMTEYGQAYAYIDNNGTTYKDYDQGHTKYPDYYINYVPTFCADFDENL